MTRRRAWDVEDGRKLRRAIGTSEDFQNDRYHHLWASASDCYTDATLGDISSIYPALSFGASDLIMRFSYKIPSYWRRGRVTARAWGRTANVAGGQIIDVPFELGLAMPDVPSFTSLYTATISKTLPTGGSTEMFPVDSAYTTVVGIDSENAVIGVGSGRLGATGGSDNYAGTWKFMGMELVWEPVPVRA